MRFDDRLETVMRRPVAAATAAAQWAQLVDLIAQTPEGSDANQMDAAIARLRELSTHVPFERRRAAATAIGARCRSEALVGLFSQDDIRIAAPVIVGASLTGDSWARLVPGLSPAARALLRGRRDLPEAARKALLAFGPADLVLADRSPQPAAGDLSASPAVPGTTSISALVARIERWRSAAPTKPSGSDDRPKSERFRFETDASGSIQWQDGGRAAALIGLSIAELATPGGFGVDGQATGAFAKRAPIDAARLLLPDGNWSIDARPVFDPESGRFSGYVGLGRRESGREAGFLPGLPHDAARQLVHELGTPLNAIRGFAEMIATEMLGPLSDAYRDRAKAVIDDSRRLGIVIDEIAVAARLDRERVADPRASFDATSIATVLARIDEELAWMQGVRGVTLSSGPVEDVPLALEESDALRIIGRLLLAFIGLANRGETLKLDSDVTADFQLLSIDLPKELRTCSQEDCFTSTVCADDANPDAPPVGLGYTLRLIAGMIGRAGGQLRIADGRCILNMPLRVDSGGSAKESM